MNFFLRSICKRHQVPRNIFTVAISETQMYLCSNRDRRIQYKLHGLKARIYWSGPQRERSSRCELRTMRNAIITLAMGQRQYSIELMSRVADMYWNRRSPKPTDCFPILKVLFLSKGVDSENVPITDTAELISCQAFLAIVLSSSFFLSSQTFFFHNATCAIDPTVDYQVLGKVNFVSLFLCIVTHTRSSLVNSISCILSNLRMLRNNHSHIGLVK